MTRFKVLVREENFFEVWVDADSENEALDKAKDMYDDGDTADFVKTGYEAECISAEKEEDGR